MADDPPDRLTVGGGHRGLEHAVVAAGQELPVGHRHGPHEMGALVGSAEPARCEHDHQQPEHPADDENEAGGRIHQAVRLGDSRRT